MTSEILITINLKAKWRLKNNHKYVWTECKQLVNIQTSNIIKKTTNGNGVKLGYFIDRSFIKISDIIDKKIIEKIPVKEYLPF